MINKTILITALARDCETNLLGNLQRIEALRKNFLHSFVYIFENDSKDKTKAILQDYQNSTKGVQVFSTNYNGIYPIPQYPESDIPDKSCKRISRMAYLRNCVLDYSLKNYKFDYFLSLDIDVYDFSIEGIINSIQEAPCDWGGLFANGQFYTKTDNEIRPLPFQYDFYAYMPVNSDIENVTIWYYKSKLYQKFRALTLNKNVCNHEYTEVLSAFGGLAIYKYEVLKDNYYNITIPSNWKRYDVCLCEHISFHNRLVESNGLKNYISRSMTVVYGLAEKRGLKGFLLRHFPILTAFAP